MNKRNLIEIILLSCALISCSGEKTAGEINVQSDYFENFNRPQNWTEVDEHLREIMSKDEDSLTEEDYAYIYHYEYDLFAPEYGKEFHDKYPECDYNADVTDFNKMLTAEINNERMLRARFAYEDIRQNYTDAVTYTDTSDLQLGKIISSVLKEEKKFSKTQERDDKKQFKDTEYIDFKNIFSYELTLCDNNEEKSNLGDYTVIFFYEIGRIELDYKFYPQHKVTDNVLQYHLRSSWYTLSSDNFKEISASADKIKSKE